ncbi:hypothetical protein F2Q69_00019102 [Brassica cretica]|uniref:Uncharacterized protein n=1 Tax=Brassica cretica TaxID=69181 RepID=A0A8S9QCU6_BRACR|nr:hypothetical protein F2Q69_00019102 [Brassica cretica]
MEQTSRRRERYQIRISLLSKKSRSEEVVASADDSKGCDLVAALDGVDLMEEEYQVLNRNGSGHRRNDVCWLYGQRAVLKFAQYIGANAIAGKHTPDIRVAYLGKVCNW